MTVPTGLAAQLRTTLTSAPSSATSLLAADLPIYDLDGMSYVAVDLIAAATDDPVLDTGAALLGTLEETVGMINGASYGRVVSGLVPLVELDAIDALTGATIQAASLGYAASNVGSVTSQDRAALEVDAASSSFGVDGSGVKIGIISDSFDSRGGYASDIASGDLPADVEILSDLSAGSGIDEGRAMAQLIHDIAPGADLAFATGFLGQANFAASIQALADAGADIIVDDLVYFAEPFFADGIIAQAVTSVTDQGVTYFSSAGNSGNNSIADVFSGSGLQGARGEIHDWDEGAGVDTEFNFILPGNSQTTRIILNWDQAYASTSLSSPGSATDLNISLTVDGEVALTRQSNNLGGDPIEILSVTNSGNDLEVGLQIERFAGSSNDDFKVIFLTNGPSVQPVDNLEQFGQGTVFGHAAASGAIGVGAAFYGDTPAFGVNPPQLENFSSVGPVSILRDIDGNALASPEIRDAVDITASNGGNTTFFGTDIGFDPDPFPNFFGTSAAAPNAAAVAALLLEFDPTLTPAQIEAILEDTAIDMDNPYTSGFDVGDDIGTGAGLIQADAALAALAAQDSPPPEPTVVGVDDTAQLAEDTSVTLDVLANDSDASDDTLFLASFGQGSFGTVTRDDRGTAGDTSDDRLVYTPNQDFSGTDSFSYTVSGTPSGQTDTATVSITVTPVNDAPVVTPARLDTDENTSVVGSVLTGPAPTASDPDGDTLTVTELNGDAAAIGSATVLSSGASVTLNADGTFTYDPGTAFASLTSGQSALDSFSYTVDDGAGASTTAVLEILVAGLESAGDVLGTNANDDIEGTDGDDRIFGLAGDDTLLGGLGNDSLEGSSGQDQLYGNSGDDTLIGGSGDDLLEGSSAADDLDGGAGVDTLDGGSGNDRLGGSSEADTLYGGSGDDTLSGGSGDDVLDGSSEADSLDGGSGNDTVIAGSGNDTVAASTGNDSVDGGTGDDSLDGASGNDTINASLGNDTIDGGTGDDSLDGASGNDSINGSVGRDVVDGGTGNDTVDGASGEDTVKGSVGDDSIEGGTENDVLTGDSGRDTLDGGADNDTLTGGTEADRFVVSGLFNDDLIVDFEAGLDMFDASGTFGVFTDFDVTGDGRIDGADSGATVAIVSGTDLQLTFVNGTVTFAGVSELDEADTSF